MESLIFGLAVGGIAIIAALLALRSFLIWRGVLPNPDASPVMPRLRRRRPERKPPIAEAWQDYLDSVTELTTWTTHLAERRILPDDEQRDLDTHLEAVRQRLVVFEQTYERELGRPLPSDADDTTTGGA